METSRTIYVINHNLVTIKTGFNITAALNKVVVKAAFRMQILGHTNNYIKTKL